MNALKPGKGMLIQDARYMGYEYAERTMDALGGGEAKLVTLALGHEPAAGVEAEGAGGAASLAAGAVGDDEGLCVAAMERGWRYARDAVALGAGAAGRAAVGARGVCGVQAGGRSAGP